MYTIQHWRASKWNLTMPRLKALDKKILFHSTIKAWPAYFPIARSRTSWCKSILTILRLRVASCICHPFWDEYAKFWSAPREARPAFVALLLLILATTNCIREKGPTIFRGDSSVERETAIMWIRNCDTWLRSQSQKHTTLIIFQLHCLSFMAKQMNSVKRKRIWTSAGTLTRQAMSAGLHRDAHIVNLRHGAPSFKRVSVFEQEMRRRIWTTISELELQADLDRECPR